MTLDFRRANGALRRRLVALIGALTLSTVVLINPVVSRTPWCALANDAADFLAQRWSELEQQLNGWWHHAAREARGLRPGLDAGGAHDLIAFGPMRVPRHLAQDVMRAAIATDVDPVYLMALADKESSFRPQVRAGTSSAVGLFQFVEATWLEMLRQYGPRHGLGREAQSISVVSGRFVVRDPAERTRLLDLRNDAYLSAVMAAELLKRSEARLARELDRPLAPTEWYLAHFLGTGDALRFLRSRAERPQALATRLLPAAARANRTLFTRPAGRRRAPVTLDEFYTRIERMMLERLDRYGTVYAFAGPGDFANSWD